MRTSFCVDLLRFARRHGLRCERIVISEEVEAFAIAGRISLADGKRRKLRAVVVMGRPESGLAFVPVGGGLEVALVLSGA